MCGDYDADGMTPHCPIAAIAPVVGRKSLTLAMCFIDDNHSGFCDAQLVTVLVESILSTDPAQSTRLLIASTHELSLPASLQSPTAGFVFSGNNPGSPEAFDSLGVDILCSTEHGLFVLFPRQWGQLTLLVGLHP